METKGSNVKDVFDELMLDADPRTKKKLISLNRSIERYVKSGGRDFRIATISKITLQDEGPKEQSIRNKGKGGSMFRQLIDSWASIYSKKTSPSKINIEENDFVRRIDDPAIRGYVNIILAEKKKLIRENRLLKKNANIIFDKRVFKGVEDGSAINDNSFKLDSFELDALEHAISKDFFEKMNWISDDIGRVKAGSLKIYKPGYLTAINKVLKHAKEKDR